MASTHVPVRTCVGCRERVAQRDLLRLAAVPNGSIRVDPGRLLPGRGAYVHRRRACVEVALARGAMARLLRTGLDEYGAATLRAEIERELDR